MWFMDVGQNNIIQKKMKGFATRISSNMKNTRFVVQVWAQNCDPCGVYIAPLGRW